MSHVTEQIEREVESTRAHLDQTMEALRDKMSLGQIMDETVRYARESGGAEIVSNFGAQMRANPIPLALVGVGLAWLMSGRGQPAMSSGAGQGDSGGNGFGHRASSAASSIGEGARSSVSRVGEAASSTGQSMSRGARRAGESARAMGDRARRGFFDILEEEPLIIGAAGIALGAAIGAFLPATETEDRYLGKQRDKMKDDLSEAAGEEWEKARPAGEESESPLAASSGLAGSGMAATSEHFSHEEPRAYGGEDHGVDLNTAPREVLLGLPMVGPERAQVLMDRRPFHTWEEIEQMPGFDKAMVDDLKSGGAQLGSHA